MVGCKETYEVPVHANLSWHLPGASDEVQHLFDQGLLLCYGFNHDEGLRSFHAAVAKSPEEPLLYWAIAYALSGNLNRPLNDPARLAGGKAAARQMEATADAVTHRAISLEEKLLFKAMSQRLPPERSFAATWVTEHDIAHFQVLRSGIIGIPNPSPHFLSLAGQAAVETDPWNYYADRNRTRLTEVATFAVTALRTALDALPGHPLALHYLIHLLEAAHPLAGEGLIAGEDLGAELSQNSPAHLVHMPSHVYFRAGRYHDAGEASRRAIAADAAYFEACSSAGVSRYNNYYKMLYFCHNCVVRLASLHMEGRLDDALATVDDLESKCQIDKTGDTLGGVFQTYGHEAERYLTWVRFGKWDDILHFSHGGDRCHTESAVTNMATFSCALQHYSRALALVSLPGQPRCREAAKEQAAFTKAMHLASTVAIFTVKRLNVTTIEVKADDVLQLANLTMTARILGSCRADSSEEQASLLHQAITAAAALPYFEPPFWPLDPALCLGELLRAKEDLEGARRAFSDHLGRYNESGWGLFGLWQIAKAAGNISAARELGARFEKSWRYSNFDLTSACY